MKEDIDAAKAIAEEIISHKRDVPVSFILSTFSDPGKSSGIYRSVTTNACNKLNLTTLKWLPF